MERACHRCKRNIIKQENNTIPERVLESKRKNLKSTIDELTFSVKEKIEVTGLKSG